MISAACTDNVSICYALSWEILAFWVREMAKDLCTLLCDVTQQITRFQRSMRFQPVCAVARNDEHLLPFVDTFHIHLLLSSCLDGLYALTMQVDFLSDTHRKRSNTLWQNCLYAARVEHLTMVRLLASFVACLSVYSFSLFARTHGSDCCPGWITQTNDYKQICATSSIERIYTAKHGSLRIWIACEWSGGQIGGSGGPYRYVFVG